MRILLISFLLIASCSQQKAEKAFHKASENVGQRQRDQAIQTWQRKVSDNPQCAAYKKRFEEVGMRHEDGFSYNFVLDMNKVWESVKSADCQFKP